MDKVNISIFKAECIALLKKLQKKGSKPLVVNSRGEPFAVIDPLKNEKPRRVLGGEKGGIVTTGDFSGEDLSDEQKTDYSII
jgi:hypothetical protein